MNTFEANYQAYAEAFTQCDRKLTRDSYRQCFGYRYDDFMRAVGVDDADVRQRIRKIKGEVYPSYFEYLQSNEPLINFIRVPSKKIALMSEWETKIEAIANSTIPVNVTSLSGVPSWMLVLIKRVLEKTGKQTLEEVWPNLEVFFHGGVAFTPYREQYKQVIQTPKMHYVETCLLYTSPSPRDS